MLKGIFFFCIFSSHQGLAQPLNSEYSNLTAGEMSIHNKKINKKIQIILNLLRFEVTENNDETCPIFS